MEFPGRERYDRVREYGSVYEKIKGPTEGKEGGSFRPFKGDEEIGSTFRRRRHLEREGFRRRAGIYARGINTGSNIDNMR